MRDLTLKEVEVVGGGEILVSPGQLGIALTDNTLIVLTGITEGTTALQVTGAVGTAFGVGWAIGSALVQYTDIEHTLGGWLYNLMC